MYIISSDAYCKINKQYCSLAKILSLYFLFLKVIEEFCKELQHAKYDRVVLTMVSRKKGKKLMEIHRFHES